MKFDRTFVHHIANLANLTVDDHEADQLATAFQESLSVVDTLTHIDTTDVAPTYQVNNLQNVLREDVVDTEHMLSQEQALQNAPHTHNGYFVVPRIIDHEA